MKKAVKVLLCILLLIILVIGSCQIIVDKYGVPDKAKIEKCLQQDKRDLNLIVNYLSESDYNYISVDKTSIKRGEMFTGAYTHYQDIDDDVVLKAFDRLLKGKYIVIGKSHGTVYFEKWRFFEQSRGLAFLLDDYSSLFVEFLVKKDELSESRWYYYETDYEKSRN